MSTDYCGICKTVFVIGSAGTREGRCSAHVKRVMTFWGEGPTIEEKKLVQDKLYISGPVERLSEDEVAIRHILPPLQRSCAILYIHFPDREGKPFEAALRSGWKSHVAKVLGPDPDNDTISGRTLGECLLRVAQAMILAGWKS